MDKEQRERTILFGSETWGYGVVSLGVLFKLLEDAFPGKELLMDNWRGAKPTYTDHDIMLSSFFANLEPIWNKTPKKYIFWNAEPYSHEGIVKTFCATDMLVISSRTDIAHDLHVPYWMYMPYKYMPRMMPNRDRKYKVGYCASNYVKHRQDMYNFLVERFGEGACKAMGSAHGKYKSTKVSGDGLPGHSSPDFPSLYADCTFALVFENSRFDGYVTEKLLAALVSGAVPIYYGARNVGDYFNKKAFIDVADFASLEECADYVAKMTPEQIEGMVSEPYLNETSELANLFNDEYNATHENSVLKEYRAKLKDYVGSALSSIQ